ncbi:MAG: group 1 glycosyl transferase, partial [Bacteroidia bacterium]|nr:group 1 glycosyl transferase [Bacteroidia bacterium]
AISYMLRSDALLLIIPDSEGAEGILTGKLFEYLGARRLIIGLGPVEGDAAAILRRCEAGRMFERSSETGLFTWLDDKISGLKAGQALYSGNDAIFAYRRSVLTREMALWCRPETKHS